MADKPSISNQQKLNVAVFSANASTLTNTEDIKEPFYNDLEHAILSMPAN